MLKKIYTITTLVGCMLCFCFFVKKSVDPSQSVKAIYLKQAAIYENEVKQLQVCIVTENEKKIQSQFLKVRSAYKEIEFIIEYYFNYYATKLNGPPIPFFEEDEPDMGEQLPEGMQVIEGYIFPNYNTTNKNILLEHTSKLLLDTRYMQQTNESFSFNDEYIFDAITEELFRLTAMGVTGFDSQAALNGLPECNAVLTGLQKVMQVYKEDIDINSNKNFAKLEGIINDAKNYLNKYDDFNNFDRMEFITSYLNPITKIIGDYKTAKGFSENKSAMFYSTVKKNNTLFDQNIFDVNKYLDDNTTSPEKIELGRKLFFDKKLSKNNTRSCATCHNPNKAFADGLVTSTALDGHSAVKRNTPSLWNTALQRNLFLDNRSKSLEDQVMQVLNSEIEMNGSADEAAQKIITQSEYSSVYKKLYPPNKYASAAQNISNAIACYERTLIALNAKFDQHMRGNPLLSKAEINGFNLFMGKAKCGTCHFAPLFSGAKPPRFYYIESEVIGVPNTDEKTNALLDEDEGRYANTGLAMHKFAFKTTTLRNIALTAPYMHNGVFKNLEDVLNFYNNGGGKGLHIAPVNQTLPFDKLNLSTKEQKNIILFLKTLTDTTISN